MQRRVGLEAGRTFQFWMVYKGKCVPTWLVALSCLVRRLLAVLVKSWLFNFRDCGATPIFFRLLFAFNDQLMVPINLSKLNHLTWSRLDGFDFCFGWFFVRLITRNNSNFPFGYVLRSGRLFACRLTSSKEHATYTSHHCQHCEVRQVKKGCGERSEDP